MTAREIHGLISDAFFAAVARVLDLHAPVWLRLAAWCDGFAQGSDRRHLATGQRARFWQARYWLDCMSEHCDGWETAIGYDARKLGGES